jgi:hypothetical protein
MTPFTAIKYRSPYSQQESQRVGRIRATSPARNCLSTNTQWSRKRAQELGHEAQRGFLSSSQAVLSSVCQSAPTYQRVVLRRSCNGRHPALRPATATREVTYRERNHHKVILLSLSLGMLPDRRRRLPTVQCPKSKTAMGMAYVGSHTSSRQTLRPDTPPTSTLGRGLRRVRNHFCHRFVRSDHDESLPILRRSGRNREVLSSRPWLADIPIWRRKDQ